MDKDTARKLLASMMLARKFEESVQYYFSLGMIHGTTHLGIGEEATSAGSCTALRRGDDVFATHRGHGTAVALGLDINSMMAEIFGKATGICKGRGGSMHLADPGKGLMGTNGIVGPSVALACGAAFAHKTRKDGGCAAAFFGDGATNEGIFHESMNLASIWKLPVLFICTNNLYGMSTHISRVMADTDLAVRAKPYRIKAWTCDGNDVEAVYSTVLEARQYIADHGEPVMVVENTYRISGHSKSDGNHYRSKEEIAYWKKLDPILLFTRKLAAQGLMTEEEISDMDRETASEIEAAVKYALESPYPKTEDIYEDVYAR